MNFYIMTWNNVYWIQILLYDCNMKYCAALEKKKILLGSKLTLTNLHTGFPENIWKYKARLIKFLNHCITLPSESVPMCKIYCRGRRRTAWRVWRCASTGEPPDWQRLCNHGYSCDTWRACLCCVVDGETGKKIHTKGVKIKKNPVRKDFINVTGCQENDSRPASWTTEWKPFHSQDGYTCMVGHQCEFWGKKTSN